MARIDSARSRSLIPEQAASFARFERIAAVVVLALLLALKIVYAFRYRIDSDETQHLHVVWGWANGLIPYRDFFDNHTPLFQFLCVPIFRALGERADIVIPMRLAVIPLYFLCLWFVYRCGTILFSRRIGTWGALCAGALPPFFTKATEFRTDDLWAALWLLCIWALLKPPFRTRNAFFSGLALGASFATSLKTSPLAASLILALLIIFVSRAISGGGKIAWKRLLPAALAGLAGVAIVPAAVLGFFAFQSALPNLYYCTITHNALAKFFRPDLVTRLLTCAPLTALASICGYVSWRAAPPGSQRTRIALVALTSSTYLALITGFWPIVEKQDFLPIAPFVSLLIIPAAQIALRRIDGLSRSFALPLVAGAEMVALLIIDPPQPHAMDNKIAMISNVLRLTAKNDFVMDAKGECVYRRRPFYYVLEGMTVTRIRLGLIKDDISERLVATRAPIATALRMPPRAQNFIEHNYVPVGFRTRVLGKMLETQDRVFPKTSAFDVVIPASYTLVSEDGNIRATLDGTPFDGARILEPGRHEAMILSGEGRLALIWATAVEKGFSPFSPLALDEFGAED